MDSQGRSSGTGDELGKADLHSMEKCTRALEIFPNRETITSGGNMIQLQTVGHERILFPDIYLTTEQALSLMKKAILWQVATNAGNTMMPVINGIRNYFMTIELAVQLFQSGIEVIMLQEEEVRPPTIFCKKIFGNLIRQNRGRTGP